MTFNNIELYCQVLGSIMKEPVVLTNLPSSLTIDDFANENKLARVIFYAVSNLIDGGSTKINTSVIEAYLQDYPSFLATYRNERGRDFVAMCLEKGEPDSFPAFYNKLKKNALLKDLKDHGYNIRPYDIESVTPGTKEEFDTIVRYEEATEDEILGYVEKNFSSIRSKHTNGVGGYTNVFEGLEDILKDLEKGPEQGPELNGEIFNSIVRGALRGKMYLRSAASNTGKTRWAVFDACSIAFPVKYDCQKNCFVKIPDKIPQRVLFITTEMDEDEIKTIVLAYISGVEENKIRRSACTPEERERVRWSVKILEIFKDYFLLERISDPNLNNVQAVIKKHVLLNDVGYVFYDYIFTSPSLISQFSANNIRQDVALGMLSNQLKEIATTYNVFVMTSTQVNGEGLKVGEKRDQRVLRDSKSIAD